MNDVSVMQTTGSRTVVYELCGASREAVLRARDDVLAAYHPLGYGTVFSTPVLGSDGLWRCHGSRSVSCD